MAVVLGCCGWSSNPFRCIVITVYLRGCRATLFSVSQQGTVDPTETLKRNIFIALDADLNLIISREEFMASKQSFSEAEREVCVWCLPF